MENSASWNFSRQILKFYKTEFYSADFRGEKFYRRARGGVNWRDRARAKAKLERKPLVNKSANFKKRNSAQLKDLKFHLIYSPNSFCSL